MIPALKQHGIPTVAALTALMRERAFKPWADTLFTPSSGNEISPAVAPQGLAYRLIGELYGAKWSTVRDSVNEYRRSGPDRHPA